MRLNGYETEERASPDLEGQGHEKNSPVGLRTMTLPKESF